MCIFVFAMVHQHPCAFVKRMFLILYRYFASFFSPQLQQGKLCEPLYTLPETNIAPENGWLEYYFPIGMAYFQGRTVSFRECNSKSNRTDYRRASEGHRRASTSRLCISPPPLSRLTAYAILTGLFLE